MKAMDFYKPEKVTVLGSGWLLELPIAEMVEKTEKVCLVDIVHPPDVIKQTASYKNIELMEADITGGLIEELWQKTGKYSIFNKLHSLADIRIPEFSPDSDPGLVISLNILSQLESLLIAFLKKRTNIKDNEYIRFRTDIQNRHIDLLRRYKSVLITDVAEIFTDRSGKVTEEATVVIELPEGKLKEEWVWDFDLVRSDYYLRRSVLNVVGILI